MAKKKKTALKPVARGFATTSVPKKVVQEQAPEAEESSAEPTLESGVSTHGTASAAVKPDVVDGLDPVKAEEQSLQNLVDKFQEKTEKEIVRTVKVIEQEHRFAMEFPLLDLDPTHVQRIFELAAISEESLGKKTVEGSEETAVARLGVTYGVLRRLNFSEERVQECLRSIDSVDLDDAYDWLYMHCEEEELLQDRGVTDSILKTPRTPRTPMTPRTPHHERMPSASARAARKFLALPETSPSKNVTAGQPPSPMLTSTKPPSRLSPLAPAYVPKAQLNTNWPEAGAMLLSTMVQDTEEDTRPSTPFSVGVATSSSISLDSLPPGDLPVEDERSMVKARILASYGRNTTGADALASHSHSSHGSPEPDDPHLEYVTLKLQLDELTTDRRQARETRGDDVIQALRNKLNEMRNRYFFDERDAEVLYQQERRRLDSVALEARLRSSEEATQPSPLQIHSIPSATLNDEPKASPVKHRPPHLLSTPATTKENVVDVFDEQCDEAGGLLEILEEPKPEVTNEGITVRVRDMALPKHFSGRTPKVLLAETVKKLDRYAAVTYSCISGYSRAVRASVSIRGDIVKGGDWNMQDVACHDQGQAEQYVATIALHALSFPVSEGFAVGNTASANTQTSFRVLPPIYRDLWDELEVERKARNDATNRSIWAKLRDIVAPKLEKSTKPVERIVKTETARYQGGARRVMGTASDLSSDEIRAGFQARQSSPAYQSMLAQRHQLPIAQYRQEILNTLDSSQVLVLSGETGCGKSTQVPSFILEDQLSQGKHCKIYCTEPRRISAISLAQRVSGELGDPPGSVGCVGSLVGYSIRLESNTSKTTRLAFVTYGIALRMLESGSGEGGQGTAFDEITHIVIDEVHERSIESDFLLIVLRSLLQQRADLKVILMSATVDAEKISDYFGGCPVVKVPGRTFPVDTRYLEDAIQFTGWAISENSPYARRLHDKFYRGKNRPEWSEETALGDSDEDTAVQENIKLEKRYSDSTAATINLLDERLIPYDLIMRLIERICFEDPDYSFYSSAILIFMPGLAEIRRLNDMLSAHRQFGGAEFVIYPLHSTISSENQNAVFNVPPSGIRKIVIATNIAETGITIPDITCVIDTGKHREMRFDEKRQISHLVEAFIAKSNAAQRRGRAGRVQHGLCFHLFTKVKHDTMMVEHPLPEMMRLSLSDLALRIKIMKVNLGSSIENVLIRALDPPSSINIQRAISALVEVRALTPTEEITPMGRLLSKLPTDVHLGKFLLVATLFRCLDPALTIAAALNSKSPFLTPFGHEDEAEARKNVFRIENSDFLTLHNVFSSWRRVSMGPGSAHKFCRQNFLSHQNLQQIEELRQQFLGYLIDSSFVQVSRTFIRELNRARYGRNKARFVTIPPELDANSGNIAIINAALAAGLYPKILSIDGKAQMRTITNEKAASFHPSSVNFGRKPTDFGVNYLSYFTLMQSKKLYAWETGPADDVALLLLCGDPDFKLISDSVIVDRKIRYRIPPKTHIALKHLRHQLNASLALQFRGQPLTESQVLWSQMAENVLGKIKIKEDGESDGISRSIVVVNNSR
ncbi:P-loop containing nucleoside triphosphate hydrolase protein [Punctularia strigosozonata HHB-11173 SS5]|uniref:P-loop containing nucleoside triphosphate hydrolase protein n=1 Tax=Punctularia strigosozonata (strain HHB-11173) TaxID=741275 RepID=UPI0004416716|nr:P-loop containing nucleoside triphosphate hydrolase protein [Punctularia strigosozonata HHB-11173 SS5]EIN14170.1 P-loop containing nucleoside triphosphate hydrolase protein [Punctularia strigosozonata HHB-11173 SS5]